MATREKEKEREREGDREREREKERERGCDRTGLCLFVDCVGERERERRGYCHGSRRDRTSE